MMKFTSTVSFLAISWPFVKGQQCQFGPDGLISGTTYQVDENNSKWVILERNNGSQCPCSYVEASCKLLDGRDCSETVVDTSSAIKDPFSFEYPEIEAVYSMKLCNYNSFNMFFAPVDKKGEARNQLEFWYTQPNTFGKVNRIYLGDRGLFSDDALAAGTCVSVQDTISIPSRISKFYMKALLNGPHEDGFSTAYCNAYSFKPIELTYDYGDGKCDVSTKATCTVKGTNKSCEEHIRSMELSSCDSPEVFTGVFEWEACNNNNRKIYIHTNPSNRKYSTNERKSNGKFIKDSESLPPTIEANSCYVPQPVEKEINPCNSNFSQINMKGVEYNRETGLHYRDKDCRSFTFLTLPVLDPNASSSTPSESLRPTLSVAPSVHPTSKPSSTSTASGSPVAIGSDATGAPSVTTSLSPTSSTSAPSSSPFATGSDATGAPSVTSSLSPSSSTSAPSSSPFATGSDVTGAPSVTSSSSPSDRPSIGQSLSPSRTVTTTPTVTPTTKAAKSPKAKSPKNSVSPTIGVTKSPTLPKGTKSPKSPKNSTNPPTYKSAKTKSPKGTKTPKAPVTTSTKTPKDPNATKSPKDPKATKSPKAPNKSTTAPKDNSTTTKSPKGTKTTKAPVTTSAKAPKRS